MCHKIIPAHNGHTHIEGEGYIVEVYRHITCSVANLHRQFRRTDQLLLETPPLPLIVALSPQTAQDRTKAQTTKVLLVLQVCGC